MWTLVKDARDLLAQSAHAADPRRAAWACTVVMAASACWGQEPAAELDYATTIRPIFKRHCMECHGPEEQASGLRVDSRRSLLRGGDSGEPAIVAGRGSASRLVHLIAGDDADLIMPPEGTRLSADEINMIRRWIDQGAAMPDDGGSSLTSEHWSFQPVTRTTPPAITNSATPIRNPIDALVAAKLQAAGLTSSPEADRTTLIRRLYFVLHGLPPTPAEIDEFVHDPGEHAYENLVERVLSSPRYGERWAQHWLDLIRFGETHGFETNRERPHAWRYRDYVIAAFNDDKPYDQFVREQLAGDASGDDVATGFLVAGPHDLVKSPDMNLTLMQRQDELADMVNTTGTALLGLTLGCARCHNHKFDPITQVDYYSLQAIFAGVQHADRPLPAAPPDARRMVQLDGEIKRLQALLARFLPPGDRETVAFQHNVEHFEPRLTRFVRFTVEATNSGNEPCLDELEIFSGERNVGLFNHGGRATCSSTLPGYEIHQLAHINDGRYGNGRSWISNERGTGWVQIELSEPARIDRIEWGRDREGKFRDRLPTKYRIEAAVEPHEWTAIASSDNNRPFEPTASDQPAYRFDAAPPADAEQGRAWLADLARLEKERAHLVAPPMAYAGTFQQPGETHRLFRGDPLAQREVVGPRALEILRGDLGLAVDAAEQPRRVAFANWVASPGNPLTARVLVNRLWQFDFGLGIVDTPSDFGTAGVLPTHPELLDWLADEFVRGGWSLKQTQRLILLSHTFRQASTPRAEAMNVDAASRLLWRFPPRRLEAEAIRDSMLAVSGTLDLRMGGPGFSGFEVELENVRHYHPKTGYGPADWRRMIYMTKVRQERDSIFGAFDCPDLSQVTPQRSRSTTPLQALNLLNSQFVLQQAELFAQRLEREGGTGAAARVQLAYRLCFGRPSTEEELHEALAFVDQHGLAAFCRALLNANEFLFVP